ncbi:MAG: replication factor A [halophilic archaeon J07HX5]|jgi:Single-stranded DNA-binding replication protein A (RPA), large (70 kD) subunit and related ssDNA-binding proteins|nr:MAG: replication factor A [halophilic archaeon J07HX5]
MGAIEEIYEELEADVSEQRFQEAVEQKVAQMEGLADQETAAMIIAHELADGEVGAISEIEPAMDEVKFLAQVTGVGDVRTFERDDDEQEGQVVNVEVADETGRVSLAFWDRQAEAVVAGEIEVSDVLRVKGRPKDGYDGLEVSVSEAEIDADAEIDIDADDGDATVESLSLGQSDVRLQGQVLDTGTVRSFDRDDGSTGQVSDLVLGDETGRIGVTLWDEMASRAEALSSGITVEIIDGYVRERDGELEVHVGERGAVETTDATVEYAPETTPVAAVELGATADIAGVVRSTDPVRTFDRDDGSEGQVRNVRLQDDSDDIRVALWGEKADKEIAPGDEILATDVEIQDGWQDDLEASAGWGSAVVVLDGAAETASADVEATSETDQPADGTAAATTADAGGADETGLSAFVDGQPADATAEQDSSTSQSAASDSHAQTQTQSHAQAQTQTQTEAEFTGTVVQTGDPVILDDGTETVTVETDARVRLGEELTVRGAFQDGRLDAEDVL